MQYAPVAIYTYSRLEHFKKTVESLKCCHGASKTELFVVSDGAAVPEHQDQIDQLRKYASEIKGFKKLHLIFREKNYGATQSIIQAEREIVSTYGRIISLEDDNLLSVSFLDFINKGLDYYQDHPNIFSITGYCPEIKFPSEYSKKYWVCPWHIPWGYGTWKEKYLPFDIRVNEFEKIERNKVEIQRLKSYGLFAYDSIWLDWKKIALANDAKVCMYMFNRHFRTIAPIASLVRNIGHDGSGENAKKERYFDVEIGEYETVEDIYTNDVDIDLGVLRSYRNFMDRGLRGKLLKVLGVRRLYYILKYYRNK